jgi:hypothetical protein
LWRDLSIVVGSLGVGAALVWQLRLPL